MPLYFFIFFLFLRDIFPFPTYTSFFFIALITVPLILLFGVYVKKRKINLPAMSTYYLVFLVLSLASVFTAVDKQIALETTMIYFGAFLVFIVAFNEREKLDRFYKPYVFVSSVIFLVIFLIGYLFSSSLVGQEFRLFKYYGHNQLGNLMIMPFVVLFPGILSIFPGIFIIISYSRSTYLAMLAISWLQYRQMFYKKTSSVFIVIVALFVCLISITVIKYNSKTESLFGLREKYFGYAISEVIDRPLLGTGAGNYLFASSRRQFDFEENTGSSHNIILDVFSENGLLAGLFFVLFVAGVIKKSRKTVYLYTFIGLFLVFLFDLTFKYNSFLFIWSFLAGMALEDKGRMRLNPWILVLAFLVFQPVFVGKLFYGAQHYKEALFAYPLHEKAYSYAIVESIDRKDFKSANKYMKNYEFLFGEDVYATYKIARYYEYLGKYEKSLEYYRKTLKLKPFLAVADGIILEKIYSLSKIIHGRYGGANEAAKFFNEIKNLVPTDLKGESPVTVYIKEYCKVNGLKCYNDEH